MQFRAAPSASIALSLTILATNFLGHSAPAQTESFESKPARVAADDGRPDGTASAGTPAERAVKSRGTEASRRDMARLAERAVAAHGHQLLFDAPGDGSIWVRGSNYKAGFTTEGAMMIPFLGSDAPANRPLRLTPESVTISATAVAFEHAVPATRSGDTISFDRKSFIENYAISLSGMEQTFVFAELPARGELVLRMKVQTDLEARSTPSEGLRFECERGAVIYGRATALDALGNTAPIESTLLDGFIELRVPAAFVESATLPLSIDPIISTFLVAVGSQSSEYAADVAYDPSTGRYMVCIEQQASASDHDIYALLLDSDGVLIGQSYVDVSAQNWQRPRVANNASTSQFMVVAVYGNAPARGIVSRLVSATNVAGSQVFVSPPSSTFNYNQINPVIGGNPGSSPNNIFLVVWEYVPNNTGNHYIVHTGMRTNGLPDGSGVLCIDCAASPRHFNPAISKSCGSSNGLDDVWTVAWETEFSTTDHDLYGVQLHNHVTLSAPYVIDNTTYDDRRPSVSSFTEQASNAPGKYMVAYDRDFGLEHDIVGRVLNGSVSVAYANLSFVEGPTFQGQDQIAPSVDSDGRSFAVAYQEVYPGTAADYDVFMSSFNVAGNTIDCLEAHQNMANNDYPEAGVQVTANHGGPTKQYMVVWEQQNPGQSDVYGGLYESPLITFYCLPGYSGVAACPCSNPTQQAAGCNNSVNTGGALLHADGVPSLSADTFSMTQYFELPNALSIFLQGTASVGAGTTFGDGVRCVGGTLKRLFTHHATFGIVAAPVGSDSLISVRSAALGDTIHASEMRYYQVYYRDPNLGFCPGGFNVGEALKVTWIP